MTDTKKEGADRGSMEIQSGYARGAEADFLEGVSRASGHGHREEVPASASVGARIKSVRESKALSLQDVAQRTGFSETTITQIEAGEIVPPLGDMVKLARALDMKMGYLLAQGEAKPYTVVHKKDRKQISRYDSQRTQRYGYTYETLAPEKKDRNMEPFLVTLVPTGQEEPPSTHTGEEFIFVLDGEIEVLLGEKREILTVEDSIYYDSTLPHRVRALGDKEARILAVLYTQEK